MHSASIASALAPGAADIVSLVSRATDQVLHGFDPNICPGVLGTRTDVLASTEAMAAFSRIVKLSDEDAAWLHPSTNLDPIIDHHLGLGASIVAITRAADGCVLATRARG